MEQLVALKEETPSSAKVQQLISAIFTLMDDKPELTQNQQTAQYQNALADSYLHNKEVIQIIDKRYGEGSAHFIGEALLYHAQHAA